MGGKVGQAREECWPTSQKLVVGATISAVMWSPSLAEVVCLHHLPHNFFQSQPIKGADGSRRLADHIR